MTAEDIETKTYIQDAFRYLVTNTGTCEAILEGKLWIVRINGREFTNRWVRGKDFVFSCVTNYGSVEIRFPRKRPRP